MKGKRKSVGQELVESLKQANAWARGENIPGMRVHIPEAYDVGKDPEKAQAHAARIRASLWILD